MSIYIKGFEVPEIEVMNGISLCLFKSYGGDIRIRNNGTGEVFNAIPVPEHGDLIERDTLPWYLKDVTEILEAPTIIPADKEDGE